MFKLIRYLLINRVTKNPLTAARIYQMIYHPEYVMHTNSESRTYKSEPSKVSMEATRNQENNRIDFNRGEENQRRELEKSLRELQTKPRKTAADKTSIDMLQAVLNNL